MNNILNLFENVLYHSFIINLLILCSLFIPAIAEEVARERLEERLAKEEAMRRKEQEYLEAQRQKELHRQQLEAERAHVLAMKSTFIAAIMVVVDVRFVTTKIIIIVIIIK